VFCVIDLSIGTAKALEFYSRGLARVRVEYVGPAPLQGSDDTMLMVTLNYKDFLSHPDSLSSRQSLGAGAATKQEP
jgi:rare lipoprotein A (peptidoglycan hydrolase)